MLNTVSAQQLILLNETDSTNNYAAKLLVEGKLAHGTVILAEKQTAGRGQRGNSWSAAAKNQFTASFYLETAFLSVEHYLNLNFGVALAVRKTIARYMQAVPLIKWPNDILVNDKKIAGILIEAQWQNGRMTGAIVGVGINLFPEENLPSGCSLSDFTSDVPEIVELAHALAAELQVIHQLLQQESWTEIHATYHEQLWKKGELITADTPDGVELTGMIREVDENGNLCFEMNGTIRKFGVQEIKFRY